MNRIKQCWLIAILLFSTTTIFSQTNSIATETEKKQKAYLENYLNSYNNYLTFPKKEDGKKEFLNYYLNSKKKGMQAFYNKKGKGSVSPEMLCAHIQLMFPEGVGMNYSLDSLKFVESKRYLTKTKYVYKLPIEYSAFAADGSLMNYKGNQYLLLTENNKVEGVKVANQESEKYFNGKYKKSYYRTGLILELNTGVNMIFVNGAEVGGQNDELYNIEYPPGDATQEEWDEFNYAMEELYKYEFYFLGVDGKGPRFDSKALNFGVNFVYMLKPFFGLGTGFSSFKSMASSGYYQENSFLAFENSGIQNSQGKFYPNVRFSEDFQEDIFVYSSTVPFFLRFQFGANKISTSLDIGGGIMFKPFYEGYINGSVTYNGKVKNEYLYEDFNEDGYGFGTYNYTNELIHSHKSDKNSLYAMGKLNIHYQPSSLVYFKLSVGGYSFLDSFEYTNSWHQWDDYSLKIKREGDGKILNLGSTFEFGIGININNIFIK